MFGLRTECWRVFGVLLVCFGAAKSGLQEDCRKDFDATVRGIGLLQYEKSLEELQQMYSGSWERNVAIPFAADHRTGYYHWVAGVDTSSPAGVRVLSRPLPLPNAAGGRNGCALPHG